MAERPLEGRVTLVTGGSRGIGAAISQQLAAAGAKVGVNYTANREAADAVVAAITAAGGEAVAIHGDVSDPEAAGAMVDATEEAFGDDLWNLVANAGITRDNLISRITPEDWDRVIDVNLGGTFHVARAASRKMLRKKRGSIVTMSSVVGPPWQPGADELRGLEGWRDCADEGAGQRGWLARHSRQLRGTGLHLDRTHRRAQRRDPRHSARADTAWSPR